jgi:hypothetical protein
MSGIISVGDWPDPANIPAQMKLDTAIEQRSNKETNPGNWRGGFGAPRLPFPGKNNESVECCYASFLGNFVVHPKFLR